MNPLTSLAWRFSDRARKKRAELFRKSFLIDKTTRILDIGSENGTNIYNVLAGADYTPENIYIADLGESVVREGRGKYGFNGIAIANAGFLPFEDGSFHIVYCSSVIEHVTVDRRDVWNFKNGASFRSIAYEHQRTFAEEIRRVARQYFIQTPSASFPLESHTWLPLAGYLPREALLPVMRISNQWWLRASEPDFNLLGERELHELFPDAKMVRERIMGITKSLMAIKSESADND